MSYDDREPQHFLGFPYQPGRGLRLSPSDTEQRVMGLPVGAFRLRTVDVRWVRHPILWTRWRWRVHREGPYAPTFDQLASER